MSLQILEGATFTRWMPKHPELDPWGIGFDPIFSNSRRENVRKTWGCKFEPLPYPPPRCSRVKLFAWNKCQRWWLILFSSIWYFVRIKKHVWSKQNTINMIFVKQVTFQDSGLDLDSGLWQIRGLGLDSDSRAKYSDLDSDSGCRKIWGLGLDSDSGG